MKTWLVTGCSSGLGRAIVQEALAAGDRVVVTARDPASIAPLGVDNPDRSLILALDVADPASVADAVAKAQAWAGHIDVLVNNAGYGLYGAVEEVSADEWTPVFQTNVFGVVRMVQAALPGMRRRASGTIVNIGSIAGLVGGPGNGFYAATKFALEALSEALRSEVEPLGIRVILLDPSGIRTEFHGRSYRRAARRIPEYKATAGRQIDRFLSLAGKQAGDPSRIARLLRDLVESEKPPFRLLIGNAAVDRARGKLEAMLAAIGEWEGKSRSTDFDG